MITADSRKVKKGDTFVAIKGETHDGHDFINQAIRKGATAVIGEKDLKLPVPYTQVKDSRKTLGELAAKGYGFPAKKLKVIGVTGTDGKTTTATLIYWILRTAGKKVGLISTVGAKIGDREYDTGFHVTNPEPVPLQKFLAKMVAAGCEYAVLEVTSHGLDQERVAGIDFEIAVLTNITHEHLDYHKTFEAYVAAKRKLFARAKVAVINRKYDFFKNLKVPKIYYEVKKGDYHQENIAAASTVAGKLGVSQDVITEALKTFPGVPGRLEEIKNKLGIKIYIDFAHTPNALESILSYLVRKKTKDQKLIAVFGSAGERDEAKRGLMAEIGTRLVDVCVFTAEDPRSEKIGKILMQMEAGIKNKKSQYFKIPERGQAIWFAINKIAQPGDTVVVCGKGHEKSMAYNGVEYPWSDHEAIKMALTGKKKEIVRPQKAAVIGLGLEGQELLEFLTREGNKVTVFDKEPKKGINYLKYDFSSFDVIYRSPGVYRYLPEIIKAQKQGVIISSAIDVFLRLCPAKIIGVTGTKGKGTTSTLIYQMMKKAGYDVHLAGNIGKSYLELLPKLGKDSWVILELSSFQLIDLGISPEVAVVLNITSDHLDWHKDQAEYVDAKKNIVRHQFWHNFAVINADYATPLEFAKETEAKKVLFSRQRLGQKYKKPTLLRGEHNWENIAAAVAVVKILKVPDRTILHVLSSFKGLEHRLELVGEADDRKFYNDSFATGPQPTMAAIKSFSEPLTLILGGYDKGLDYQELVQLIAQAKNMNLVILIGDLQAKLAKLLVRNKFQKFIKLGKSEMEKIVQTAAEKTPSGGVVILSPAAASFDMFIDYKDRGDQFKKAVANLK